MIQDILSILFKPFKKPMNHSRCYETPRIGCQATVFALEIVWVVKWMICFGSIIHAHMCTNWYIHAQISQNYVQIYRYIYIYIPVFSSSSIPTKKGIPPGKTWICWKWRWIFRIGKSSKTGGIYRNHLQLAGTTPPWAPRCFPPRWRHISWPGLGHDIMYESMNGSWLRQGCGGFVHVVPKNVHCHICHSHGEVGEKNWTRIPLIVARLVFGDSIWAPWRNTGHSGVSGIALWLRAAISYG